MCPRTFPRLAGGGVVAGGEPLSFLFLLCVVAAGVSCCRVVGLVVVVVLCLVLVLLGLVLCPVSLWLLSLR